MHMFIIKKNKYKTIINHINFNSKDSVKKRLLTKPKQIIYNVSKKKYSNNRQTNDNYLLENLKKIFNKDISLVNGKNINYISFHDLDENINKFLVTYYKSTIIDNNVYVEYWLSISYSIFKEKFTLAFCILQY